MSNSDNGMREVTAVPLFSQPSQKGGFFRVIGVEVKARSDSLVHLRVKYLDSEGEERSPAPLLLTLPAANLLARMIRREIKAYLRSEEERTLNNPL